MDVTKILKTTGVVLLISSLAACAGREGSTRPSCPVPDGTRCMSTLDVYEATNSSDHVSSSTVNGQAVGVRNDNYRHVETMGPVSIDGDTLSMAPMQYREHGLREPSVPLHALREEPYREPAKVLRIYVPAWEDADGDLHMPGYIYSEVEARRWTVGDKVDESDAMFHLLQGLGEEAAKDSRAAVSANTVAGRPSRTGNTP